ncbi:MAG: lipopolysaccharide biosynthesis protein [Verrucomicrobia bacterium]|nr:lipopolysaccharide biosynthesis protein [Verrucomicrobiota bacterium]
MKRKTARGALVSTLGQASNFAFRIGSMMILARLLNPEDFGLVAMVTACTGFLSIFRDCGLSMATVQQPTINRTQISTLFWINLAVGLILAFCCVLAAPLLAKFYHEPRLFWVTVVTGMGFIFTGASAQHRAVLQRELRFITLTTIDLASLLTSIAVGIGMAWAGFGYWSLVGMAICIPLVGAVLVLVAGGWIPNLPRRGAGLLSMMKYGGTVTLNSIIAYAAANTDKVLLGRFWGAEVLGIYGRAYQLINIPTDNLNTTIGQVAFPALARVQNDPERLRSYFLKGYGLFLSLVVPLTMGCGLFATDIVRLFLGWKWEAAAPVFRLLAPTIFTFALVNPMAWLMMATGHTVRNLWITCAATPIVIAGYVVGLRFGPTGVAAGFSTTAVLLALPIIYFATRGTSIKAIDALKVIMRPIASILVAACAALIVATVTHSLASTLARLVVDSSVLFGVYALMLCFVMGQKDIYLRVIREIGIGQWFQRRKTTECVEPVAG